MVAFPWLPDLPHLEDARRFQLEFPHLPLHLTELGFLSDAVATRCPREIILGISHGPAYEALYQGFPEMRRRVSSRYELLLVTSLRSLFRAYDICSNLVLGPALLEFGQLPRYVIWTSREFEDAASADHPAWRTIARRALVFYESQ